MAYLNAAYNILRLSSEWISMPTHTPQVIIAFANGNSPFAIRHHSA